MQIMTSNFPSDVNCSNKHNDIELVNFHLSSSISSPSLSDSPKSIKSLTISSYSAYASPSYNSSSTKLSQNFLGITCDEETGNLRDRYGFDLTYDYYDVKEYLEFAEKYEMVLIQRSFEWEQFFSKYYPSLPPRSNKQLKHLIRQGIPSSLRGQCWFHYSGAEANHLSNYNVYEKLITQTSKCSQECITAIDKDLCRTFPDNVQFRIGNPHLDIHHHPEALQDLPINLQRLRRILTAFSLYRPEIGYCQSMNFIAGLALLFMSEEETFWLLVTIVDQLMPLDIYSKNLMGTNIDSNIFKLLLKHKFPKIWALMEKYDVPLSLITCQWFLTVYINTLPIESVLRVWDAYFFEGTKVLFRIALALFKLNEKQILACSAMETLMMSIKNFPKTLLDCDLLMKTAFNDIGTVKMAAIEKTRERLRLRWFSSEK